MNEVRKSQKSTANRIASILEDAEFVQQVVTVYNKPVVANRRAGLWYVPPQLKTAESYFKSTDGHINQWQLSLKRLNLHLVDLIEQNNGIIIVDTTRRGKKMPDALSKTVPIWCAVLNKVLLNEDLAVFPPQCVSRSEQDRIKSCIPAFCEQFKQLISKDMWPNLSKPLRPLFVTPNEPLPSDTVPVIFETAHPVVCVTASRQAQDGELLINGFSYVQGAADDHELWAPPQFSPEVLWLAENSGLREPGIGDFELRHRIENAVLPSSSGNAVPLALTSCLFISTSVPPQDWNVHPKIVLDLRSGKWALPAGKKALKPLAAILPQICTYFESQVARNSPVLVIGESDCAHCVALMLDCRYFEPNGQLRESPSLWVPKEEVTTRNAKLIARSASPPSRAMQNVIGSFLRSKYTVLGQ